MRPQDDLRDEYRPPPTAEARIPAHLRGGLRGYFNHHQRTGGFLTALLSGDLIAASQAADPVSRRALGDIVLVLLEHAPAAAWRDPAAVALWLSWRP